MVRKIMKEVVINRHEEKKKKIKGARWEIEKKKVKIIQGQIVLYKKINERMFAWYFRKKINKNA